MLSDSHRRLSPNSALSSLRLTKTCPASGECDPAPRVRLAIPNAIIDTIFAATCSRPAVSPHTEQWCIRSLSSFGTGAPQVQLWELPPFSVWISCRNVPFPKLALQQKLLFMNGPICGDFRKSPVTNHELHSMLLYGRLTVPACNDRSVLLVVVVPYVVDLTMEFRYQLDLSLQPVRVWDLLERRDSTPCGFRPGSRYLIPASALPQTAVTSSSAHCVAGHGSHTKLWADRTRSLQSRSEERSVRYPIRHPAVVSSGRIRSRTSFSWASAVIIQCHRPCLNFTVTVLGFPLTLR